MGIGRSFTRPWLLAVLTIVMIVGLDTQAQDVDGIAAPAPRGPLAATVHPPLPTAPTDFWFVRESVSRTSVGRAESSTEKFARAVKLIEDGEFAAALPLITSADLFASPLAGYAQYYRALALIGLNRMQDAEETLDALAKTNPSGYLSEAVPIRLADVQMSLFDAGDAVSILDGLQKSNPGLTSPEDVLIRLGRAAETAGDRVRAIEAYRKVYYESPLTQQANDVQSMLQRVDTTPLSDKLPLEIARAERLYTGRRWAQARAGYSLIAPLASGGDKDLVTLRLAECDYFLQRYRASSDALLPFLNASPYEAEARFYNLSATRSLGDHPAFIAQARALVNDFPDSPWAAETLNSLASHYIIEDEDDAADLAFRDLVQRFPTNRYAERAYWKIGWWAYRNDRFADAARAFESGAAAFPRADMRPGWLYWSGRAHDEMSEPDVANQRYRLAVADYGNSYYGRLASKLLEDRKAPAVLLQNVTVTTVTAVAAAQIPTEPLIRQLVDLELYEPALKELQYAQRAWGNAAALDATVAWIRHEQAQHEVAPDRFDHLRGAINTMKRAYPQYLAAGGENLPPAVLGVIYPLDYWPLIKKYSDLNGLDPYLMSALIAQESTFTADIRSSANAVGLMQLIPSTGRRMAREVGIRPFTTASLRTPETNIRLGMTYFKNLMDRFGGAHLALASYNAGESRVSQWLSERPGVPQDEFIDDIPFPETQNYVKRILGTAEDYRRLYGGGLIAPNLTDLPRLAPARAVSSPAAAAKKPAAKKPVTRKPAAKKPVAKKR